MNLIGRFVLILSQVQNLRVENRKVPWVRVGTGHRKIQHEEHKVGEEQLVKNTTKQLHN